MNELIERINEGLENIENHQLWTPKRSWVLEILSDSKATLLALQTQLERAEDAADGYSRGVYSKTMLDAAAAIAKGRSDAFLIIDLRAQLERVERETIERCAKLIESNVIRICEHEFGYNTKKGIAASIRALPSAKTETE